MLPHATATFCDDIRFEIQNKITLIGCYGSDMYIPAPPPFTLPKLGVYLQLRAPLVKLPTITVNMYMPEETDPFFTQKIFEGETQDFEIPEELAEQIKRIPDPMPARVINQPFLFAPFVIPKLGTLRLRLLYGSDFVRLDSLVVHQNPTQPIPQT